MRGTRTLPGGCIMREKDMLYSQADYIRTSFAFPNKGSKSILMHRLIVMLNKKVTEFPYDRRVNDVSHLCHNKRCLNIEHLCVEPNDTNIERVHCFLQKKCTGGHSPLCIINEARNKKQIMLINYY